jgi:hypothetical protein
MLWQVVGSETSNSLPWSNETFTLGADGTMTVTKFDQSVTRTIEGVVTP